MTQSRAELIDIVGRILASGDWDNPNIDNCDIGSKADVLQYAEEIVTALRPEIKSASPNQRAEIIMTIQDRHTSVFTCNAAGCNWSRIVTGFAVNAEREALTHLKTHD